MDMVKQIFYGTKAMPSKANYLNKSSSLPALNNANMSCYPYSNLAGLPSQIPLNLNLNMLNKSMQDRDMLKTQILHEKLRQNSSMNPRDQINDLIATNNYLDTVLPNLPEHPSGNHYRRIDPKVLDKKRDHQKNKGRTRSSVDDYYHKELMLEKSKLNKERRDIKLYEKKLRIRMEKLKENKLITKQMQNESHKLTKDMNTVFDNMNQIMGVFDKKCFYLDSLHQLNIIELKKMHDERVQAKEDYEKMIKERFEEIVIGKLKESQSKIDAEKVQRKLEREAREREMKIKQEKMQEEYKKNEVIQKEKEELRLKRRTYLLENFAPFEYLSDKEDLKILDYLTKADNIKGELDDSAIQSFLIKIVNNYRRDKFHGDDYFNLTKEEMIEETKKIIKIKNDVYKYQQNKIQDANPSKKKLKPMKLNKKKSSSTAHSPPKTPQKRRKKKRRNQTQGNVEEDDQDQQQEQKQDQEDEAEEREGDPSENGSNKQRKSKKKTKVKRQEINNNEEEEEN